jgi:ribonuclease R
MLGMVHVQKQSTPDTLAMMQYQDQILEHLADPEYQPLKAASVARELKIKKREFPKFREAIKRLISDGRITENKQGRLRLRESAGQIAGIFKRISSGGGFVVPHGTVPGFRGGDIFVNPEDVRDAHTGDEVLVRLSRRRRSGNRRCGEIVSVLERSTNTFVGTYLEEGDESYVRVDGNTFTDPVYVGDPGAKGAIPDDKVVIEMLRFPSHLRPGEAVLTKVLGPRGESGVDTLTIIHEFGLPVEFSQEALDEAHRRADRFDETAIGKRLDLTKEVIITIDPADARDFDDAISLKRSKDGHWHLGVHIADVSHFVEEGSLLDAEARHRGTSVYLPRHVIPMLPEVISNGLASLQQGKVRFTKSVFIEFTADGIPVHTQFANSAIKVNRRFAYEEVMPVINDPEKHRGKVSAKVRQLLENMHTLAMKLRKRRFAAGALELHLPEVKIDFNEDGQVTGAHEAEHDESHQMIEEFMLAANIAVAVELSDRSLPFLRRVHGDPDYLKLKNFAEFANALGYQIEKFQSRFDLQEAINKVKGQPAEHALNYALLRSMKQAEYSEADLGHYALAVENYCHVTSPIRRYPDLMVHRLFHEVLTAKGKARAPDRTELAKLGQHCSSTERRAAAAERELTKVKLLTYMNERIGETMEAVITGVERFGIFCQGVEIPVEGLIHITALDPDEYFDHDRSTFSLVGRRSGKKYRLGDRVRVTVAHVDVDRRELDFRIALEPVEKRPPRQKRRRKSTR